MELYKCHSRYNASAAPWEQFDLVHRLESTEGDYRKAFALSHLISGVALRAFVTKGWNKNRVFKLPGIFFDDIGDLPSLRRAGLVVKAADLPFEDLLAILPFGALYAPLKARGVRLQRRTNAACRFWYAARLNPEIEVELRRSVWLQDRATFLPTAGWSWAEFQDFRDTYAGMCMSLADWLGGELVNPIDETGYLKFV